MTNQYLHILVSPHFRCMVYWLGDSPVVIIIPRSLDLFFFFKRSAVVASHNSILMGPTFFFFCAFSSSPADSGGSHVFFSCLSWRLQTGPDFTIVPLPAFKGGEDLNHNTGLLWLEAHSIVLLFHFLFMLAWCNHHFINYISNMVDWTIPNQLLRIWSLLKCACLSTLNVLVILLWSEALIRLFFLC